ncbi:SGNH/GDSL hydrolase family protein [Glaciibacter flavus]|uniref:SGNH/GDSL hydrolase family protein n=2 Tax=Orlajensenia flava TaxID=2565934 RepID=A0A4S4FPW5_9MICO|nr:SGNH/GDSL hydrolase family protein [Glaciibacter flavus]
MRSMRGRTAIAGAVVIAGGATVWARWLARRQHHWARTLADAIPVNSAFWREQGAKSGEVLYVAIGDSAAQGIGASRPSHSYVGFVVRRMRELTTRRVRVANLAISGATIRIAIDKELPLLEALHPDVLTVCIGANDIAAFDPERFDRDVRELFERLPDHAIVADLPSFYFLPGERKVRVANTLLRAAAAERGFTVVPLHDTTARQGLWGVTTQFAGDLFHPNDRGYRIWAAVFEDAVAARLAEVDSRLAADSRPAGEPPAALDSGNSTPLRPDPANQA